MHCRNLETVLDLLVKGNEFRKLPAFIQLDHAVAMYCWKPHGNET